MTSAGSPSRKALLLRVGMDRGTGGALGPIFPDGTFEYIPIPESHPSPAAPTFADLPGRHVPSLAGVLPPRLAARQVHSDPDFTAATYGDAALGKRRQLARLAPGDRLVFYTGLIPRPPASPESRMSDTTAPRATAQTRLSRAETAPSSPPSFTDRAPFSLPSPSGRGVGGEGSSEDESPTTESHSNASPRLFAIGSLTVRQVHRLEARDFDRPDLRHRFGHTAHFLRQPPDQELVLVEGDPRSTELLPHARLLGDGRDCLLGDLSGLGYQGSLRRAVGHWLTGCEGPRSLDTWLRLDPGSLIDRETRLIPMSFSALPRAQKDGDLLIANQQAQPGDWILALSSRHPRVVHALARVNQILPSDRGPLTVSSLFWTFAPARNLALDSIFPAPAPAQPVTDTPTIRKLVAWFDRHFRAGFHAADHAARS